MKSPFNIWSPMGIRKRLFFLLVLVFVPLLLLEAFIFYRWYDDRKKSEMQANLELARAVGRNFETFLQGLVRSEVGIGLALTASPSITDEDRNRMLDTFAANNPAARSVMWLNPEGRVVAASYRPHIGYDLSDRSYFTGVKEGRDWVVSELIIGRETKKPSVTIGCGIRDKQGLLLGLVAFATEIDRLDSVLGIVRSGDAGVSLIDNKGMHAYRYPTTAYTWEQRNWINLYPVIGEVMKGKEVVRTHESKIRGSNRIVAFTPVASIGWVASCSRAENEVVAAILKTILPQALLILLLTVAAFAAAVTLARPISTSIRRLQDHAAALGRGEVEKLETIPGPPEIKNLARTFDDMAEKVRFRETALKESEARLRRFYESGLLGVIYWNMDGAIVDANDKFLEIAGYTREELTAGKIDWRSMTPPEYLYLDERSVSELRTTGVNNAPFEKEYIRKDGTRIPVLIAGAMLDQKHFEGVAFVLDITERKRAEEDLRQSREWLRVTLESIGDAVMAVDTDARITFLNPVAGSLTGWELEEALGQPAANVFRIINEETRKPAEDIVKKVLVEGKIAELANHTALISRDGREIPIEDTAAPIRDNTGNVSGVVLVFHDDTERRRAQEVLQKAHKELDIRVRERTSELSATISRLELTNQELQEFAHVASHDLQEPLRKIQTFCDLAKTRCSPVLDSTGQEYLDLVFHSANRMRQLLRDVLQFSRVASKSEPFKRVDLSKIVREAADVFETTVKNTGSWIEVREMPALEADESQMLRLFQNLIGNALKFQSGQPLQIQIHAEQDENGICEIRLKDNGIGFGPQYAKLIFKPFQRLHTRTEYDGTGMGLTICRKIVERHGGNIRAESEPGKGSTFIIRLPAKQITLENA